jgi:RNA polymerase sigma factor (sigma-70 family)
MEKYIIPSSVLIRSDAAFPPWRIAPLSPRLRNWRLPLYGCATGGARNAGFVAVDDKKYFGQNNGSMKDAPEPTASGQGLEGVLLANRDRLIRFLITRGAGDAAEDVFQELWMRLSSRPSGPIGDPMSYLFRAANNHMLDRYRSERQLGMRELAWGDASTASDPSADTALISREQLKQADAAIDALGARTATIFRSFRLENKSQRAIAAEQGVSLSTVESDLRKAYEMLAALRRQFDEQ